MKDQVYRVEYFVLAAEDRPGVGADLSRKLAKEGVNLLAILEFPTENGKVQVDLIPEHSDTLTKAAKKLNLPLGPPKVAFLAQGTDRPGAWAEVLGRLGDTRINVRATSAVACGGTRYGGLIWVAPSDVEAASRALGATTMATHQV